LDGYLGEIIPAMEEAGMMDYSVIILTADHGGIGTNHGGITLNEMETPLVFYGKGVKKIYNITESTMVIDVPATEAWLLCVEPHEACLGNPVTTAFFTKYLILFVEA
jgi:Arylsulfatase A and related enzymes